MPLTQSERPARLYTDPFPDDTLLLLGMQGRESLSSLYQYDLVALSENENLALDDLLGHPAHVDLDLPSGDIRRFSGLVSRFIFAGFHGRLARYELRLSPWLWFLTQSADVRIHQNAVYQDKSVVDIIRDVCADHGFTDLSLRLERDYPPLPFCVQYRETAFQFLSRLMERAGIYYFFEHGDSASTLVLADDPASHEPNAINPTVIWRPDSDQRGHEEEYLTHWRMGREVRSGAVRVRDFDFERPRANQEAVSRSPLGGLNDDLERYDYPAGHRSQPAGETLARLRLEGLQSDAEVMHGQGNVRGLIPGFLFELTDHYRRDQNQEYLLLSLTHEISLPDYESEEDHDIGHTDYRCTLTAMPSTRVYRPPMVTARPIVHGPHTAIVVGEPNEVIHTDEHRRIKVQFHWDREGQRNQNSSCWLRLAQNWAGIEHGSQVLPRVGDEVIVEFLEGDPDQPVVTGSLYNGIAGSFFDKSQTGIRTRFIDHTTRDRNFSQLRFEDQSNKAEVSLHTGGGVRIAALQHSHVDMVQGFQLFGAFKDDNDRDRALEDIGNAGRAQPVPNQHGHINIIASRKITIAAPEIEMHEFKKDDCGKKGSSTYEKYKSEYRKEYQAQYGGTYTVTYGYTPELAAAVETCEDIPEYGEYQATYNMRYRATYNEPYVARYKKDYRTTYEDNVTVDSRAIYTANYDRYDASYNLYVAAYNNSSSRYLFYQAYKGLALELKGVSLGVIGAKFEETLSKFDFKQLTIKKDGVEVKTGNLGVDIKAGATIKTALLHIVG